MKTLQVTSEVLLIGGFVLAAHLAFVSPDLRSGLESAGSEGADLLRVTASSASIASLVEAWDSPPQVEVVSEMAQAQVPMPTAAPEMPAMTQDALPPVPQDALRLMATQPDAPPLPVAPAAEPPKLTQVAPPAQAPLPPVTDAPPQLSAPPVQAKPKMPPKAPAPPQETRVPDRPPEIQTQPAEPLVKPKPVQQPVSAAASRDSRQATAREAAGTGGDLAKGNKGKDETATVSKAKGKKLAQKWGQQIRNRVARNAPKGVGKGRAIVQFTVAVDGTVSNIRLAKSSGNTRIDQAALKSVRSAGKMPKAPKGLKVNSMPMAVPILSR